MGRLEQEPEHRLIDGGGSGYDRLARPRSHTFSTTQRNARMTTLKDPPRTVIEPPTTTRAQRRRTERRRTGLPHYELRDRLSAAPFFGAAALFVGIVLLLPLGYTVVRSFIGRGDEGFVGFDNYVTMFQDPNIQLSLLNTFIWAIGALILPVLFGLGIAVMTSGMKLGAVARGVVILPYALAGTIVAIIGNVIFTSQGSLNQALTAFGLMSPNSPLQWLLHWPLNVIAAILIASWQSTGVNVVLFTDEGADGFDTVQWLAGQQWSNGRVGMYGASYYAATQLLAAIEQPPALKAIAPQITTSEYYENWIYQGGALQVGFALYWALGLAASEVARGQAAGEDLEVEAAALRPLLADPSGAFRARPLDGLAVGAALPAWREWLRHPDRDDYWVARSVREHFDRIDVPALHVSGWFDLFHRGTIDNFRGLTARGVAEQSIIIGPWAHAVAYDALGEVDFGGTAAASAIDLTRIQLDWFRRFLSDETEGPSRAPVTVFVMGPNVWREETAWPPERATLATFAFGSAGDGTGILFEDGPAERSTRDFDFDPADPAPTLGGATLLPGAYASLNSGPRDQRPVEERADVLVYTGKTLDSAIELCGDVRVILWASTSAADTDWTAKLVDVHPDGRALSICDGIVRARYRSGTSAAGLLEPDVAHEFVIDLGTTAIVLPAGHALRVEISSSNFPRFDVNPNHGGDIASATEVDYVVAHQRILHGLDHPSRLEVFTVETPRDESTTG